MAKLFEPSGMMDGVFVQKCTIVNIETNPNMNSEFKKQIDFILTVSVEKDDGNTFEKKHFLSGNLMGQDKSIPPHLTHFLYAIDILGHPNKDAIIDAFSNSVVTEELKQLAIGKQIKLLSYVSGIYTGQDGVERPSYKYWDGRQQGFRGLVATYNVLTPDEQIIEAFKKALKSNYPPKYTPEVLEQNTGGEEYGNDDIASDPSDLM